MLPGKEIFLLFIGSFLLHLTKATNTKHMYALCPPDFFGIGTECYYISQKKQNWLDAHFDCKDRKSRLAEPNRYEDRMLRRFLVNNDLIKESKWIGGNYNWAQRKWQWQDGRGFTYQSFSQTPGGVQELQYHCAILNPDLKYRWSASSCVEKHAYICQHRMPYVNEKHRARILTRWNQTYPNEEATQVEVVLKETDMLKRGNRQSIPANGRSTNNQRLSRHRNYLANEWLKKYRSQQYIVNRNAIPNEINLIDTRERKISQRPNRLAPRRRNPSIARDDFIQFERKKNIYRGPLITNKVDDFEKPEPYTVSPPTIATVFDEPTRQYNRVEDVTAPPRRHKANSEIDLKEKKRLEETRRLLETGRYGHSYTRRRITTTTPSTTTTTSEANIGVGDNERVEMDRNWDNEMKIRRQQEEEDQERRRDEEIRRNEDSRRSEMQRREEEERRRLDEEKRVEERRRYEEKRIEEDRLQNQINEETLRLEHEEEMRRSRLEHEEQRRAEERNRIHEQHLKEREEKMRARELELQERELEEQKIREDEERRQEENRQRLEEIERQQREEEERKRQEAENKRIEEENRRRKKEELRNKQKMRKNDESSEEQVVNDLRLKEKLRRENNAKLKERIKNLSPEAQLKFFQLRGKRVKKQNGEKENETATANQL